AEDGIRDRNVTGVQTCALPILHYRKKTNAFVLQPIINICAIMLCISFSPANSPLIFFFKLSSYLPVVPKTLSRIRNFISFLFRRIVEQHAAKGFFSLATKAFFARAIEQ